MTRQKICQCCFLFFISFAIFPADHTFAQSVESCLPTYTSVNVFVSPDSQSPIPMLTETSGGIIYSTTKTYIKKSVNGTLIVYTKFDDDIQYSFPFNVYTIMILQRGQVLVYDDYTYGCTGPGISFFPGHSQELAKVKLLPFPDEPIQIILWGRL